MPSTVQSVNPFRPGRLLAVFLVALAIAYAIGYSHGADSGTKPEPPTTVHTVP